MCEPVILGTLAAAGTALAAPAATTLGTAALAASVGAGVMSAASAYQQGQVAKATGRNNQIMAEYAAVDARRRGDEEAARVQRQASQVAGAQRTALASRGLDISYGTAGELQDQVDFFSQVDQGTARFNAERDAWSLREQGRSARAQGDAEARQGAVRAFSTLLTTGGQVADKWKPPATGGQVADKWKPPARGY